MTDISVLGNVHSEDLQGHPDRQKRNAYHFKVFIAFRQFPAAI